MTFIPRLALMSLIALLVAAPNAFATVVTGDGNTITITGEGVEANDVVVTRTSDTQVIVTDTGDADANVTVDGDDCRNDATNPPDDSTANNTTVGCTVTAGPVTLNVTLGDGDDAADLSGATNSTAPTFSGGNGDDNQLIGTPGTDVINGDAGVDNLAGSGGGDTLNGGAGDDTLLGDAGIDTLNGDDGDDLINGGADGDTINAGAGDDLGVSGGDGDDVVRGGPGNDFLFGDGGNDDLFGEGEADQLTGGAGQDDLNGGANDPEFAGGQGFDPFPGAGDTASYADKPGGAVASLSGGGNTDGDTLTEIENLNGGPGSDTLTGSDSRNNLFDGGAGDDTLNGRGGDDNLNAGTGNDTLNGDAGDDNADGGAGNDTYNGGDGDDAFATGGDDDGDDTYAGGAGQDSVFLADTNTTVNPNVPRNVRADLQGDRDDGPEGQNDQLGADVEDITTANGNDTVTGNDQFSFINTGGGDDTVDPGAGSDVVGTGDRNDTINARDGFADQLGCGRGSDTVNVDQLDRVGADCEVVNRQSVTPGTSDTPPRVEFASPAANARLSADRPTPVTVTASDDRGVAEVRLIDDGATVAVDNTAPYQFNYQPRGGDVGDNTLIAVAVDTAQQASAAFREFNVNRFTPRSVSITPRPTRDRRRPYRFTFTGRVSLPAGVTAAQGCAEGVVTVVIKRGSRTISTRRANLRRNCTYTSTTTFRDRRRLGRTGRLNAQARWGGNDVLSRRNSSRRNVRAG